jgi:pseudouridine-5'-phosphate glycosidase/pseudouridine kinase
MLAKQTRRGTRAFYSAAHGGINSLSQARARGAPIDLHPEIVDALANGRPIVALETTIVTHGMPYPTNLTTARSVEEQVRKAGAVPATIGLISGRIKIGLHEHELERLADVKNNPGEILDPL